MANENKKKAEGPVKKRVKTPNKKGKGSSDISDLEFKVRDIEQRLYKLEGGISRIFRMLEERKEVAIPADYQIKKVHYPFVAFLGQENVKKALILNAVNPRVGGILIRGHKGTGKTTLVRGFTEVLPEISIVKGCRFNCNPRDEANLCFECRKRLEAQGRLPSERIKTPVIEIPLNITEDALVGRLNIEELLESGGKTFEPGLLANVNRGILYIDEINLLDDTIVDLLLDVSTSGVNVVEREGARVSHPSNFIMIGTMDPMEGELRPQLLDRFGLLVEMKTLGDKEHRVEIIKRNIAFQEHPLRLKERFEGETRNIKLQIEKAKMLFPKVVMPTKLYETIAEICNEFNVIGHRAEIFIEHMARANAAYEGRNRVIADDIIESSDIVLPHRMKKTPFSETLYGSDKAKNIANKYEGEEGEEIKTEGTENI